MYSVITEKISIHGSRLYAFSRNACCSYIPMYNVKERLTIEEKIHFPFLISVQLICNCLYLFSNE